MSASFHKIKVQRSVKLSRSPDKLKTLFHGLRSEEDLAALLDCSLQQLVYWTRIAPQPLRYRKFELTKKNGTKREIEAPHRVLSVLQHKLLQVLDAVYSPRAPVHGFVKGRGIISNANCHRRRAWVLNIDLEDFFPSIHFGRVRGIFRAKPFVLPEHVATTLARLMCSQGRLPQGACTSPVVSNIICAKMDGELRRLAEDAGAMYTRYADDITFSVRRRNFPQGLAGVSESDAGAFGVTLSEKLRQIVADNGFRVNVAKVRIQPWKRSQRVTGLTVNDFPNVPRAFVRRTRAMLHAWSRYGLELAQARFIESYAGDLTCRSNPPSFQDYVRGNIAYIGQVRGRDDRVYYRLLEHYHVLIGDPILEVPFGMSTGEQKRDVFICHASEDKKDIVEPLVHALQEAGVSVWFDKAEIRWGDSVTGKVNEGIASSRYVVVVMSAAFAAKNWPRREMQAAMAREISAGETSVLPLMVGGPEEIERLQSGFPLQADKLHLRWTSGPGPVVEALMGLLRR